MLFAFHFSKTNRPGSLIGSVRSITALIRLKIAVFPPMASASVITQTAVKPRFFDSCRIAYRTSWDTRSNGTQPHASRVCSLIRTSLPKARRAAWLASSGGRPLSRCSSSSNSRSDLSSRSKSVSLLWSCHHHFMSTLLCGRPHHPCNSFRHLLPLRLLDNKLLLAFVRQSVIFEFPVSIRSRFPFGNDRSEEHTSELQSRG